MYTERPSEHRTVTLQTNAHETFHISTQKSLYKLHVAIVRGSGVSLRKTSGVAATIFHLRVIYLEINDLYLPYVVYHQP